MTVSSDCQSTLLMRNSAGFNEYRSFTLASALSRTCVCSAPVSVCGRRGGSWMYRNGRRFPCELLGVYKQSRLIYWMEWARRGVCMQRRGVWLKCTDSKGLIRPGASCACFSTETEIIREGRCILCHQSGETAKSNWVRAEGESSAPPAACR